MVSGGQYVLLERLGSGGAGDVWRARLDGPQGFGRPVAIKLLRDVDDPAPLRREAELLAAVRHRAVVRVDGLAEVDGRWGLVMELDRKSVV